MKTKSAFLLALALGLASLSTASAGLITDPLSIQAPVIDQGLATDPLGQSDPLPSPKPTGNVSAAAQFLANVLADGQTIRLSDLFLNPEFFAAAHAAGPEADALRGQIDWLMLSGVILGVDGDDGLDDLTGDAGDDLSSDSAEHNPNIVAGPAPLGFSFGTTQMMGFSFGATQSLQRPAPAPNGIILGGPGSDTIILGGPGSDTLAPHIQPNTIQPPVPGIILGGPGSDTIILGGPGSDTLVPKPANGFIFGTNTYLK